MPEIFGHKVSTPAAVAIAGGGGLAVWFAWKQHQSSAAGSASSSAIDPVTGLPYSQDTAIDPLTGMAYLQEAQEYGSVSAAEQAVAGESSVDLSGAYGSGTGVTAPVGGTAGTTTGTGYASNAAWAQAVEAGLTDIGYTSTDIAAALGQYLGSLPETAAQASIVNAALAEYGPPPVGSYTVILAPSTGSTGSGTASGSGSTGSGASGPGTPATAAVPDCDGQTTGAAHNTLTAAGFKAAAAAGQTDDLTCTGTNPPAGTQLAAGSTVEILAAGTTVPQCKGLTAGAAHNTLTAAGLKPAAPAGQKATAECTGTNPPGGSTVNPGSSVEILT